MPGYSPEFNPDEILNADIKRHLHSARARSTDNLARRDTPVPAPPPTATPHRPQLLSRSPRPLHDNRGNLIVSAQ
ncbi:hypothetical protein ACQP1G_21205 [Nocardia sp. CA-107356]|uniref:hypothetical protein n=1 Tax=Nocardia sp. CA-107356 TaxID=3239972 RepID=UPI003D8E1FEB